MNDTHKPAKPTSVRNLLEATHLMAQYLTEDEIRKIMEIYKIALERM